MAAATGLSRGAARAHIGAGAVFLNGRRCRVASRLVRPGDRLRVGAAPAAVAPVALPVLYEDDAVVAVDKPAGMPSAPTRQAARGTAQSELAALLRARSGRPQPLFVVHRLDAGTSGVLVFARTRAAAAALSAAFAGGGARKRYLARVGVVPPAAEGEITAPLAVRGGRGVVDPGGRPARTAWRVAAQLPDGALLAVEPHRGRLHQIRAHLAAAGMPILGDKRYGGRPAPRLMLHAEALTLPPSAGGHTFRAPPPPELDAARLPLARARC